MSTDNRTRVAMVDEPARSVRRGLRGAAAAAAVALTLAACSGTAASSTGVAPDTTVVDGDVATTGPVLVDADRGLELVTEGAVLIDVRTPAEFDEAHVDGAVLIDVSAPDFETRLAELDQSLTYVVYCRTGNRSAAATARMSELGFTSVHDAGGLAAWSAAGAPIVRG